MKFKLFFIIFTITLLVGCSSSEVSTENDTVYENLTFSGHVAIDASSGTSSLEASAYALLSNSNAPSTDESNYMIVIQNQISNRLYLSQLDADGTFHFSDNGTDAQAIQSVNHDGGYGNHFMVMLLQKDPLEVKAVAYLPGTSEEGYSGFQFSESFDQELQFNYNSDSASMTVSETHINDIAGLQVDEDFVVRLVNDTPAGATNFGKSTDSQTSTVSDINQLDPDQDGQPNIFDGMNNGSDLDNLSADNKTEGATVSDSIASSIMFMNLKIDLEDSTSFTVTDNAIIVLEVIPRSSASIHSIRVAELVTPSSSSIRLLHTNYQQSLMEKLPNGFTEVDSYPTEGSLWSADDYQLYQALNQDGDTVYTALIKPNNNQFEPGNLILLEVNLTDGSKEYYFNSINFKFQTIPTDQTNWTHGGNGSTASPYNILDTGGRVFTWDHPLDEFGTELEGLNYQFELFYYTDNSGTCDPHVDYQIGTMQIIDFRVSDLANYNDISETEIDFAGSTTQCLQLDIAGSYPYGDNAALKIYLKRNSW
ncbi:hypothetical protein DID76_00065 [Candidatus Marinamargulisbacteria bacterium SCGC AG-414-C22]|nr:hypothetical protein DID76_00065 [Candidatus Marinamargulisbacteria bacterium SCGC AG-414-C22]